MINEVIKRQIKTMGADEIKKALAETNGRRKMRGEMKPIKCCATCIHYRKE